jgi:hypothetical protein
MVESSKAIQIFAEVFTKETSNKAYYAWKRVMNDMKIFVIQKNSVINRKNMKHQKN